MCKDSNLPLLLWNIIHKLMEGQLYQFTTEVWACMGRMPMDKLRPNLKMSSSSQSVRIISVICIFMFVGWQLVQVLSFLTSS